MLAAFAIMTGFFLLIFTTAQQVYRMSANDPQIEMAEETARIISQGQEPQLGGLAGRVDISHSLKPFIIVYNAKGEILISQAEPLSGNDLTPPAGVFTDAARQQDRFTWQPRPGIRIAAVMQSYTFDGKRGYVLAGRSLRESERRTDDLFKLIAAAWVAATALVVGLHLFFGGARGQSGASNTTVSSGTPADD